MPDITVVKVVYADGTDDDFVPAGIIPPPLPCPEEETEFPGSPPDPPLATGTWFQVFQVHSGAALPGQDHGEIFWSWDFSRTPLDDVPVIPANIPWGHIPGRSRWNDAKDNPLGAKGADRRSYDTAYWFLQHSERTVNTDTAHHDFLDAIRLHVQSYGPVQNQINDKFMKENPFGAPTGETQGLPQYPYERGKRPVVPIVKDHPGAVIEVIHLRSMKLANGATSIKNQLLRRIVIPATDPHNSATKWWYQDGGVVIATNPAMVGPGNPNGTIAKLFVSGVHPAYSFTVSKP